MDKDRVEGGHKSTEGKVKEVAGTVTGDKHLQNEGHADQTAGKTQGIVGKVKDAVRQAIKK